MVCIFSAIFSSLKTTNVLWLKELDEYLCKAQGIPKNVFSFPNLLK